MIYLDNNASTALDPEVREAMAVAADSYGNPSSVHSAGRRARRAVEESREEVARLIGAGPDEIFFTSGGTEANALAIFGTLSGEGRGRVVLTAAEHPSVREPIASLADRFEIRAVPLDGSGALDPANVIDSATPATRFVSVMAANNEYGGLYPIGEIATRLRERGVSIHTDAVQAAGRVPIDVESWGVDLLALSAHKLHGPKGVGALWVRRGLAIRALVPGGGQEKKIRGGTENTIGIVGFGIAARLARERLPLEPGGIARLRDRLESGILESIRERGRWGPGRRGCRTRRRSSSLDSRATRCSSGSISKASPSPSGAPARAEPSSLRPRSWLSGCLGRRRRGSSGFRSRDSRPKPKSIGFSRSFLASSPRPGRSAHLPPCGPPPSRRIARCASPSPCPEGSTPPSLPSS